MKWGLLAALLLFPIPTAIVMANKGHTFFGGFVLGFFLGPIGLVIALLLPQGRGSIVANVNFRDLRKCPACREFISSYAPRCKHCGTAVEPLVALNP